MTSDTEASTLRAAGYVTNWWRNTRVVLAFLFGVSLSFWLLQPVDLLVQAFLFPGAFSVGVAVLLGALNGWLEYRRLQRRNVKARALANQALWNRTA